MPPLYFTPDVPGQELLITQDFSAEELASRRERIAKEIGTGSHLLLLGAPPARHDINYQDAIFYYFTGIEVPYSYLLVEGDTGKSKLFMPTRDFIDGEPENRLGFEDADWVKKRLGFDEVLPSSELTGALQGVKSLYMPHSEAEGGGPTFFGAMGRAKRMHEEEWDNVEPRHMRVIRLLKERVTGIEVHDIIDFIKTMRTIKSPAEIELMRKSGALAGDACVEAMKITKPGITETDLQAMGEYVYRSRGHAPNAYGWICAGGKNTWDGHYHLNNATLKDGDVVLMDCGPDLRHYTSDIARVWPVSGTFSQRHRRICGVLLEYHKALLSEVKAGVLAKEVYERADQKMTALCAQPDAPYHDMKWMIDQMIERGVGYLNHGVGLSVHDPMDKTWRTSPLREGFVVVCDPMVWLPDEPEYLRVEDTLLVTAEGCEVLTSTAPIELDEIEALVGTA